MINWRRVTDDNLPPLDVPAWLWDGKRLWIGCQTLYGGERYWANCYSDVQWTGNGWICHTAEMDDLHPTHWMPLPSPPEKGGAREMSDEFDAVQWLRRWQMWIDQVGACEASIKYAKAADELERLRAERQLSIDRDYLGQIVRLAWIKWAREQSDPKPSWLVPWDGLPESDREADRRIGEAVAAQCVSPELLRVETELERLQAERDAAIRLLRNRHQIRYERRTQYGECGFFLRGQFIGTTIEDLVTAEAAVERLDEWLEKQKQEQGGCPDTPPPPSP